MCEEEIVIRPLSGEDVEAVSRLEQECFSCPWTRAQYEELVGRGDCLYLVVTCRDSEGERVIGCCGLHQVLDEGEISNVMVASSKRGCGIGKRMLGALLDQGKERGIRAFTLEVRVSNEPARALYEKLGFVSVGIRPGFYDKPREDARIYWLRNGES